MNCIIITIGDEILIGQIVDSNSACIATELNKLGIEVLEIISISDDKQHIINTLSNSSSKPDIIIVTGGLGPTKDDKTKNSLCEYFNCELKLFKEELKQIKKIFSRKDLPLSDTNISQAYLPEKAKALRNKWGTAPGMYFEKRNINNHKVHYFFLPGVPFEMKSIMQKQMIKMLMKIRNINKIKKIIEHKTIFTTGIPESFLSDKLVNFEKELPGNIKLAYLPSPGIIKLRLTGKGNNKKFLKNEINNQIKKLKCIIPEYIFSESDENLENKIGKLLKEKKCTLSIAESCTGGYLSHLITKVPGSSDYFKGSAIAYHNKIKTDDLNIPQNTIKKYGAVSEEVVSLMAENIRKKYKTDYGLATSGIAGPGGGNSEKPVGTVWIACSGKKQIITQLLKLNQDRGRNIELSSIAALNMLRKELLKIKFITVW